MVSQKSERVKQKSRGGESLVERVAFGEYSPGASLVGAERVSSGPKHQGHTLSTRISQGFHTVTEEHGVWVQVGCQESGGEKEKIREIVRGKVMLGAGGPRNPNLSSDVDPLKDIGQRWRDQTQNPRAPLWVLRADSGVQEQQQGAPGGARGRNPGAG